MFTFFFIYQKKFPDIRKKTFFDKVELKILKIRILDIRKSLIFSVIRKSIY